MMKNKKAWELIIDNMTHCNEAINKENHSTTRQNVNHSILAHLFRDGGFDVRGSCVVSLTADQLRGK